MKRMREGDSGSNTSLPSNFALEEQPHDTSPVTPPNTKKFKQPPKRLDATKLYRRIDTVRKTLKGHGYDQQGRRAVGELVIFWIIDRCHISPNGSHQGDYLEAYLPWYLCQQLSRTVYGIMDGCKFANWIKAVHPYGILSTKLNLEVWDWFICTEEFAPVSWEDPNDEEAPKPASYYRGYMEVSHLLTMGRYDALKKTNSGQQLLAALSANLD